jgi:pseudouridine-5'-phosphate glycosidase
LIRVADEVREASAAVALETTIVAHGFPEGEGIRVGLESERRVREAGAVPATIGVLDGEIRVGLTPEELERFTAEARKLGPRDLAACVASGETGATTVGGTLAVCRQVGIRFLATGGIGGVHRGDRFDVSADLLQLASAPVVVTSSGVKSLLDVEATSELLESLGVPVLGYRTDSLPRFYDAEGGPPVSQRVESAAEAAAIAHTHWKLGGGGILLANPPPRSIDVEALIESALDEAVSLGTTGQPLTPFVLGRVHEESGGKTLEVNRELAAANAGLAAAVAVAVAKA